MNTTKTFCGLLGVLALCILPSLVLSYEEIVITNGGTIRGMVKVNGNFSKLSPLQISKFKEICKDVPSESLIIGPDQELRSAVGTLVGMSKGKAVEMESVHEFDNSRCRLVPN